MLFLLIPEYSFDTVLRGGRLDFMAHPSLRLSLHTSSPVIHLPLLDSRNPRILRPVARSRRQWLQDRYPR